MRRSVPAIRGQKRWARIALTGTLAAALGLAGAPGASAAEDFLQFSRDGRQFAPSVSGPLFADSLSYVPGASSGAGLWVRNNSTEPAALSTAAVMVRSDPELAGYLGFTAGRQGGLSSRVALGKQGSCSDTGQSWDLGPGESLKLDFGVDLSLDAPNATQNREADFDVVFLLVPKSAGTRTGSVCTALGGVPGTPENPGSPETPGAPGGSPGNQAVINGIDARSYGDGGSGAALAAVAGTGAPATPGAAVGVAAPAAALRGPAPEPATGPAEAGIEVPDVEAAGFRSTVEPVIRSLSGTLLIAMSVALCAAVVLRVRSGRYE